MTRTPSPDAQEPGHEELWPDVANISAGPMGGIYSHYARFAEVEAGRRWRDNDTIASGPTGEALPARWSKVYTFEANPKVSNFAEGTEAHQLSLAFAGNYTRLLVMLHNVFNGAPETYFSTMGAMHSLTTYARTLLTTADPRRLPYAQSIGPPWEYVPAASQYDARGGSARPIIRGVGSARRLDLDA